MRCIKVTVRKRLHYNKLGMIFCFGIFKQRCPVTDYGFHPAVAQGFSKKKGSKIIVEEKPHQAVTRGVCSGSI